MEMLFGAGRAKRNLSPARVRIALKAKDTKPEAPETPTSETAAASDKTEKKAKKPLKRFREKSATGAPVEEVTTPVPEGEDIEEDEELASEPEGFSKKKKKTKLVGQTMTEKKADAAPASETPAPEEPVSGDPEEPRESFSARVFGMHDTAQQTDANRKKLMKKFKRAKKIPSEADVERFNPPLDKGLSDEQVETRFQQFLFNDVNKQYSKSYATIFLTNLFTFFNLLCVLAAVALIYARAPITQFLFAGIFACNIIIGIIQEILAKKQIDKLAILISATAKVIRGGVKTEIPLKEVVLDDVILLEAGQQVPADCKLAEGTVEVNESLLTGESVPIKKQNGETLYAGSFIASGACKVRADKVGRATYLNKLTSKAKKYKRPHSEIMSSIYMFIRIIGIAIPIVAAGMFFINWTALHGDWSNIDQELLNKTIQRTCAVVIGMIPSGLLLLTSIAMAVGVRRLAKKQTLVQDLYSLETLARVNVLCLDKTGTITDGRMTVNDCMILNNYTDYSLDEIMGSILASLDDNNQTSLALYNRFGTSTALQATATIPFSSRRKLSAVSFADVGTFAMGAPEFVLRPMPPRIDRIVKQYAQMGLRVLVLAFSPSQINGDRLPSLFRPVALITLADNIRSDAIETIKWFRDNDVDIKIISGDNPVTVSEVARRVGVKNASKYISLDGFTDLEVESVATQYTVFGRVTPEQKAILVKALKKQGNTVAMTGDGVNDILALKEADCAISVASGSEAARNVSHLVLMDNNFLNLPNVVYEGRRVINNIKNSASLYLMKTLFIFMLAIICICTQTEYFFTTDNMLLFEFFVAAVPSTIISLQPNTDRVKGKFFLYVLSRAIPASLTLLFSVMAVYLGNLFLPAEFESNYQSMLVVIMTFAGLVTLFRILQPFNILRAVVYALMVGACCMFVAIPELGRFIYSGWGEGGPFTLTQWLYMVCVLLIAFPVSNTLIKACDLMNSSE